MTNEPAEDRPLRRVTSSWKVIEGVLKEHAHSAYKSLRGPAPKAAIARLEARIGTRLPQSLVTSLRRHDGMSGRETFIDYVWLLPVAQMSGSWRITMDNPWDDGDGFKGPRYYDGKRIQGELRWRKAWVPFATDAGGNHLGIDLDPGPAGTRGQVFRWNNYGSPPPKVLAPSYTAWLDAIAEELLRRRFQLDELGDLLLARRLS